MCKYFKLIFILPIQAVFNAQGPLRLNSILYRDSEPQLSLEFDILHKIVKHSDLRLVYIMNSNSNPQMSQLLQQIHHSSIQTCLIAHHSKCINQVKNRNPKIISFFLENLDELLDLFFNSILRDVYPVTDVSASGPPLNLSVFHGYGDKFAGNLTNYCVMVDGRFIFPQIGRACDEVLKIASAELDSAAFLTDTVTNLTRGVHLNDIWNSQNYLIFILKNSNLSTLEPRTNIIPENFDNNTCGLTNESQNIRIKNIWDDRIFCFKLFWRLFKGRKTVICHAKHCERYDPFTESILLYEGGADVGFFDFSLKNMHKKPVRFFANFFSQNRNAAAIPGWNQWTMLLNPFLLHLGKSLNCTFEQVNMEVIEYMVSTGADHADGIEDIISIKFDVSLHSFEFGPAFEVSDLSQLDFSPSFGSGAVCIVTPHSAFIPQSLVFFRSFTPLIWALVLITILLFVAVQHAFQYFQCEVFRRLYSETETDHYRDTSSLLTVYAYFVCGNPPTLRLGRLFTGKILFTLLSFSAIIISTIFLSCMTTLLSQKEKYPEIDRLKDLEQTNLFIQTWDLGAVYNLFDQLRLSNNLRARLTDSLVYSDAILAMHFLERNFLRTDVPHEGGNTSNLTFGTVEYASREALKNELIIAEADAFLLHVPFFLLSKQGIILLHALREHPIEYHLMEECLTNFPFVFPMLKFSFLRDEFNLLIHRFYETGLSGRLLDELHDADPLHTSPIEKGSKEPRAYSLNDLQSAFIFLGVGLFTSFLVFIGEILKNLR